MKRATDKIFSALVQIKGAYATLQACRAALVEYLASLESRPPTLWRCCKTEQVRAELAALDENLAILKKLNLPQ